MSNGGRHHVPWSSRHLGVLGMEDVTAYFHYELAESVHQNLISHSCFQTFLRLDESWPTEIPCTIGVVATTRKFGQVIKIERSHTGIDLLGAGKQRLSASLDLGFLERRKYVVCLY